MLVDVFYYSPKGMAPRPIMSTSHYILRHMLLLEFFEMLSLILQMYTGIVLIYQQMSALQFEKFEVVW